jgi:hypothetical protein
MSLIRFLYPLLQFDHSSSHVLELRFIREYISLDLWTFFLNPYASYTSRHNNIYVAQRFLARHRSTLTT